MDNNADCGPPNPIYKRFTFRYSAQKRALRNRSQSPSPSKSGRRNCPILFRIFFPSKHPILFPQKQNSDAQLYLTPVQLKPILECLPTGSGDIIFAFAKSGTRNPHTREINPRQSFQWIDSKRVIRQFQNISEIYHSLNLSATNYTRDLNKIKDAVNLPGNVYRTVELGFETSPVTIFVQAHARRGLLISLLRDILPILESYRGQTLHALNDTQNAKRDELVQFVPEDEPLTQKHRRAHANTFFYPSTLRYAHVRSTREDNRCKLGNRKD